MGLYLTSLNILVVAGANIFFFSIVVIKVYTDKEYMEDEATWTWRNENAGWFFKNILAIAFCDTIALYIQILASHNVTAPLRTLLQQGSIPVTMIASWGFLRRSYKSVHMVGAIVIIAGIFLAVLEIIRRKQHVGKLHSVENSDSTWSVIFFMTCFPLAVSSCLKEYVMTHETNQVEMNQVNAWVAFCQLIITLIISPLSYLAANKDSDALSPNGSYPPMSGFLKNVGDGLQCGMWGDNEVCNIQCRYVFGHNNTNCHQDQNGQIDWADCDCGLGLAPVSVWLYVGVCCCFNLLMLYVIKEGTAALFWISSAAIIPVVSLISTSSVYDWLDLGIVKFSILQICGMMLVVLGIGVYRSQPEELPEMLDFHDEEPFADARASMIRSMVEGPATPGSPDAPDSPGNSPGSQRSSLLTVPTNDGSLHSSHHHSAHGAREWSTSPSEATVTSPGNV